jgi:hypothetical protein
MAASGSDRKIANRGHIGPGGINCNCCGPAPGKLRTKFFRAGKKRLRNFWKKEIKKEIDQEG